jgi:hypothetical protein
MADVAPGKPFTERVIVCADQSCAQEEAELQQRMEIDGALWICLRQDDEWVAKRTPGITPDDTDEFEPGGSPEQRVARVLSAVGGFFRLFVP